MAQQRRRREPHRKRPDPSDQALAVRGGQLSSQGLRRRAELDRPRLSGRYGLSIFADEVPLEELVRIAPIPHERIHRTTVGRLRLAGFEVEATGAAPIARSGSETTSLTAC